MKLKLQCGTLTALLLAATMASADTLELKNGSLIKGKFLGGTETDVTFRIGSTVQKFSVADIVSLKFDGEGTSDTPALQPRSDLPDSPTPTADATATPTAVTIPAGTRIAVRTIDAIDSSRNLPGDRFEASLAEPLLVNGNLIVEQDAFVYGQLTAVKESGTFTGRSQLRLELTGMVVHGKLVPIVTGDYAAVGSSRGASTAKRAVGGAALGAIIGAAADGGKGAAIGAGAGAGAGAGSEIVTGGDAVKVPSETLLDFTLEQDVTVPARSN